MSVWDAIMKKKEPPADLIFFDYEILQEKIERAETAILNAWMETEDTRPWSVSYSGGKDSTATLKLMATVISRLSEVDRNRRKVYVLSADTIVENPSIEEYLHDTIGDFNAWAKREGLPFEAMTVSRPANQGFFFSILGKGYTLPNNSESRWCTHKLKIEPQNRKQKELNVALVVVGTRKGESLQRDGKIGKYATANLYRQKSHNGTPVLCPVIEFTVEDVWGHLQTGLPWSDTLRIQTLYKEATGECGFSNPQGATEPVKACGARFGCWTCPPIAEDKSTEKMSDTHRWMEPLTEWRRLLKLLYGEYLPPKPEGQTRTERSAVLKAAREKNAGIRRDTRSGYMRNGRKLNRGQGSLRIEYRRILLAELLDTQEKVNLLRSLEGLPPIELIHSEELSMIYAQWIEDAADSPWLK